MTTSRAAPARVELGLELRLELLVGEDDRHLYEVGFDGIARVDAELPEIEGHVRFLLLHLFGAILPPPGCTPERLRP